MALAALSEDEQRIVFTQLCNVLEPRVAVDFSSASSGLWVLMQGLRQQLRTDHAVAAALCLKVGMGSCKELREAKEVDWRYKCLIPADLTTLGTLGPVLPALEQLILVESSADAAGPDGVQRLVAELGAGALPAAAGFSLLGMHVGDAGASALAAALGRGALPRLKVLCLHCAAIGDAGLVALASALRRLPPTLHTLCLSSNPFGDEGLAALVAPPPAGALPPPTGVLANLIILHPMRFPTAGALANLIGLDLSHTQVADAGCATLAAAIGSGALPALDRLDLEGIPASAAAVVAVREALDTERRKAE
eukprot:scaffold47343_cov58-Phaeocystis_antarctica.AAC.1